MRELLAYLVDQVLGARGLVVDRFADALLDLGAVALQGGLDPALALARLALDSVAGLARSVVALRRAVAPRRSVRFTVRRSCGAVGLELLLGGGCGR